MLGYMDCMLRIEGRISSQKKAPAMGLKGWHESFDLQRIRVPFLSQF